MPNLLKPFTAAIALFFAAVLCAYADDSSDLNLKISSHWLIGCDNLEECSAIGYPIDLSEGPGVLWYITAKWHKDSDIINFSFSDLGIYEQEGKQGEGRGKISVRLCQTNTQCRLINAGDRIQVTTNTDPSSWPVQTMGFTLDATKLKSTSYLVFNAAEQYPIYLKEFLQNRNSVAIDYLPELGGKQKTYKMKTIDDSLDGVEVKKLYPQYDSEDDNDDDIKNEQDCLSPNYAVEYENGDKFIFACENAGYNAQVGKYNGKTYQDFNVVDTATFNMTGPGLAWNNLFGRIYLYNDNKKTFEISNRGRAVGDICGWSYDFAYNGKKFIIDTIRYMPLCIGIPTEDWPVIYKRPS